MSRSGYSDDCENWDLIRWRGAVASAIRGARGQKTLRDLLAALDAMQDKRLVANELQTADGEFCTLGALGAARGVPMADVDGEDREAIAAMFDIAPALAAEIMYENDDDGVGDWKWIDIEICGPMRRYEIHSRSLSVIDERAAEKRWRRMRNWVASHISAPKTQGDGNG